MGISVNENGAIKTIAEDFSIKGTKLFYTIVPPDSESMGAINNENHRVYKSVAPYTVIDEGILQVKKSIDIPSLINPSLIVIVRMKETIEPIDNKNLRADLSPGGTVIINDTSGGSSSTHVGVILPDICCDATIGGNSSSSAYKRPLVRYNSSNHKLEFGQYAYKKISSAGEETTIAANSLDTIDKYYLYIFLE